MDAVKDSYMNINMYLHTCIVIKENFTVLGFH